MKNNVNESMIGEATMKIGVHQIAQILQEVTNGMTEEERKQYMNDLSKRIEGIGQALHKNDIPQKERWLFVEAFLKCKKDFQGKAYEQGLFDTALMTELEQLKQLCNKDNNKVGIEQ